MLCVAFLYTSSLRHVCGYDGRGTQWNTDDDASGYGGRGRHGRGGRLGDSDSDDLEAENEGDAARSARAARRAARAKAKQALLVEETVTGKGWMDKGSTDSCMEAMSLIKVIRNAMTLPMAGILRILFFSTMRDTVLELITYLYSYLTRCQRFDHRRKELPTYMYSACIRTNPTIQIILKKCMLCFPLTVYAMRSQTIG